MAKTDSGVDSANLKHVEYDSKTQELVVAFMSGRIYAYSGVHPNTVRGLMNAGSKGKYFARLMRFRYNYREL